MMKDFDAWERIWDKSMAMAKTYHTWKSGKCKDHKAFSKRKDALYKEVEKQQNGS